MNKPTHKQRSGKCFVFVFAAFVILCAILLVFASIVLPLRTPLLQFKSASVTHLNYTTWPTPSYEFTMIAHLAIHNQNFGSFDYENGGVSVLHGNTSVGERGLSGGRVKARETRGMNVTMNLHSNMVLFNGNLSDEILSGSFNLTAYAKLTGTVHLFKILNNKKTTDKACTIRLNLTSHSVHNLQCYN